MNPRDEVERILGYAVATADRRIAERRAAEQTGDAEYEADRRELERRRAYEKALALRAA